MPPSSQEKILAAFTAFVFFLPLIVGRKTDFIAFYMRQSFPLFAAWIALAVIQWILPAWGIIWALVGFMYLALFLVMAFLAWNAYQGKRFSSKELENISNQMIKNLKLESLFAPVK